MEQLMQVVGVILVVKMDGIMEEINGVDKERGHLDQEVELLRLPMAMVVVEHI